MTLEDRHDASVLDAVASPERARQVIADLVGPTVGFGPVPVGPHDMATARAHGTVGTLVARRTGPGAGVVTVPARLDVTVSVGRKDIPVDVALVVHVGLTGRVVGDTIEIDVAPIRSEDIEVDARTSGVGGVMVRRMADLDGEIRRHVGVYISTLLATPEAIAACTLPITEAESA